MNVAYRKQLHQWQTIDHLVYTQCLLESLLSVDDLSLVMRKPAFCICEIKGAGNSAADQRLCFRYIRIYFLNPKFHASSHLLLLYSIVLPLLGNPEDRFSRVRVPTILAANKKVPGQTAW